MDGNDGSDDGNTSVSVSDNVVSASGPSQLAAEKLDLSDDAEDDTEDTQTAHSTASELTKPALECPVCLQPCIHPVRLPCNHVFCFLCVKGVANRSKRCALCRQEIPLSYFHNPKLVRQEDLLKQAAFEDGYQWFYEGRNGWWQYDERTSSELEEKYKLEEKTFELLIAGFLYVIDLDSMLQYRRNDPTRRRRIKRDLENIPEKKGVAGLRTMTAARNARQGAYGVETSGTAVKGQAAPQGDGRGDHNSAVTVLSPVVAPAPRNSPYNSQSSSSSGIPSATLPSAMAELDISHAGDGRSTSPEPRPRLTGAQVPSHTRIPSNDGQASDGHFIRGAPPPPTLDGQGSHRRAQSEGQAIHQSQRAQPNGQAPAQRAGSDGQIPSQKSRSDRQAPPQRSRSDRQAPPQRVRSDVQAPPQRVRSDGQAPPPRAGSNGQAPPLRAGSDGQAPPQRAGSDGQAPPQRAGSDGQAPPQRAGSVGQAPPQRVRSDEQAPSQRAGSDGQAPPQRVRSDGQAPPRPPRSASSDRMQHTNGRQLTEGHGEPQELSAPHSRRSQSSSNVHQSSHRRSKAEGQGQHSR